ncbi:MAG: methyltransferase domain-containing protein [Parcubacteria group bacterium]
MEQSAYYDKKLNKYSLGGGRLEHIEDFMPDKLADILDMGCGSGSLAKVLGEQGHTVYGADISPEALKLAKEHIEKGFCFDFENGAWPDDLMAMKFDAIIATEVIEHLFDPESFIKKLKQLLKPNGMIIVTTPNLLFWKNRFKIFFGKFEYEEKGIMDFGHIRFFTVKTARKMFEKCDLAIEAEHHFYPNLYKRGLTFLGKIFPGFFAYKLIFKLSAKA